ncbi:MAG: hypothetical protein ACRCTY_09215, partial [Candidatus Adiutrix sp.]
MLFIKKILKKLWPDSHCGQLVLAMLIGAAVLQGINMYAVCYIQHSYNSELQKVRYDYNYSIYLALITMEASKREVFLAQLAQSQSALSQPPQFQLSSLRPNWAGDNSSYGDYANGA